MNNKNVLIGSLIVVGLIGLYMWMGQGATDETVADQTTAEQTVAEQPVAEPVATEPVATEPTAALKEQPAEPRSLGASSSGLGR